MELSMRRVQITTLVEYNGGYMTWSKNMATKKYLISDGPTIK